MKMQVLLLALTLTGMVRAGASRTSGIALSCREDARCGREKIGRQSTLGESIDTTLDSCDYAEEMAMVYSNREQWQEAFDTIRWYVEHCYMLAGYNILWSNFGNIEYGFLKEFPDSTLWMRAWLISVRNLNPTDGWYCDVVTVISGTYNGDFRSLAAISKFLLDNPRCKSDSAEYASNYDLVRHAELEAFYDTVSNPKETYDSTLPSMHDLGLDSLLEDAAGVSNESSSASIILDSRITMNPFPLATSVSLSIGREAYVTIQVFDLLGRNIEGAGYAAVFEPGSRTIPLDLSNAPPGAYYVRIATANNEVRTIKITKQ